MSGWLRNLQGQLTELASEVLNEATEETSDPESELQVITKKLTEAESQLANEQRKGQEQVKKINDLEEQLFAKNVEIDAVTTKYNHIIENRDSQIRSLQVDIERLRHSNDSSVVLLDEDDEDGLLTDSNKRTERLKDQIEELRKEVAHWKRIVNESLNADHSKRIAELECKLGEQKSKSEAEMAALVLAHNENIAHLRSEYESKFSQVSHQLKASQTHAQQTLNPTAQQSKTPESDDWQNAWDDVDNLSLPTFTVEEHPALEHLQKAHKDLKQKLETITKELNNERMKNKEMSDEVDRLAMQAVDSVLNDQLQNIRDENESLRMQLKKCNEELHESNEEVEKLIEKLDSANAQIHSLRDKYEKEAKLDEDRLVPGEKAEETERLPFGAVPCSSSMRSSRRLSIENAQTISVLTPEFSTASDENSSEKDKELEKLRRENNELTMAYNDLNEEFENHKAEHGSVLISNRDLTDRIDALKANLIEYEERYELCKAENAETVQQLEKLTNDFERLRQSFEASNFRPSSGTPSDEVERLRMELESSKDERERLRSDVSRFRTAVGAIDLELNSLRESNERLARDNMAMGRNLDKFIDIREMLERSDVELKSLRDKFIQLQMEHREKENIWKKELVAIADERDSAQKALDECRTRCTETESALQRYRSGTNEGGASYEFMEMKTETVQTGSSEEGTTDSNSGWEKMTDWDASTVVAANVSSTSTQNGNNPSVEELKEALEMVTEKTEECEELRRQKCEIEKEFELRQTYIEELMAQTNALQLQQQTQADAFSEMRERANKIDCEKLEMERNLIQVREQLEESTRKMDELKDENMKLASLLKKSESVSHSHDEEKLAEIDELKKRLADNEKHYQDELSTQKYQYEEQLHELSEEKLSLDGRVEALEEQLIKERKSLKSASESQQSCKEELAKIKEEKVEMLKRIESLNSDLVDTKSSLQHLNTVPVVNVEDVEKMREEISTLHQSLKVAEEKCDTFKLDNSKLSDDLQNMKSTLAEVENQRNELVTLVEQKHNESVQYHSQLQVLLTEKEEIAVKLKTSSQQIENLENQIASCKEARDKSLRECDRLREHLVSIEETSTKEAVIAEERETDLRKRIRELEQKTEATEDSVIQSSNNYQQQIGQLSDEIDRLRQQKEEASKLLVVRERTLADTQKALSNLQTVVRDLGVDHEAQLAQQDEQLQNLKAKINTLQRDIEASKKKEEMLVLEKQVLEDSAVHLKEELSRRDIVIEELEAQIDERGAEKGGGASSSSYQIDDETLRQLFLSYFTAEKDKQPDIAMLMASVLGYSQEDVAKIQAANQSSSRGWFGFSFTPRSSATQNSVSITEQFIRFLENESIAASASRSLPLTKSDNNNKSTMRSSITIPAPQSSLPDELRDLVDS